MNPKVKVNAAPAAGATAAITKSADAQVIMAGGMQIAMQESGVLSQYRIVEVVGDSAKNETYMNMVLPLLWITEIDGLPQPAPSTKRELEALIQRLGKPGVSAVMKHVYAQGVESSQDESVKN